MGISFVWFDLGYTLVYMQRETSYRQVLEELGHEVPASTLRETFHLVDKLFMREYPGVFGNFVYSPMPWYLGLVNYRLGIKADLCATSARWVERQRQLKPYWLPYEEAATVLEELRHRGVGAGLISNWDHTARRLLQLVGLAPFLDPIVISSEVGHSKPGAEIFRIALERAGVSGPECLYVGDNYYDDAVGCRKVDMQPLVVNRLGRLGVEEIDDCPIIQDLLEVLEYV